MKNLLIALAVVAGIVLLLGTTCVGQYNRLVNKQESVDSAWAQVETVLQRRADLVPNLVNTVQGFAAQERTIFTRVAEARSRLLNAQTPVQAAEANQALGAALGRLLAISERYPELKSNQTFIRLQDELAGTENRIAVARKRYNDAVREYNTLTRRFPTNLMAGLFGFGEKQYFQTATGGEAVPKVEFPEPQSTPAEPQTTPPAPIPSERLPPQPSQPRPATPPAP